MEADYTDSDVNQMIENVDKFDDINGDPNAKQEEEKPAEQVQEEQPAAEEQPLSFKTKDDLLKYKLSYKTDGGKDVEEDLATILKRASGGYHFAQRMNEYNQKMQQYNDEYLPQIDSANQIKEKYGKFEEYAKENPEWYDHWSNAWENRYSQQQGLEQDPQQTNVKMLESMLAEKLNPINDFMNSYQQQQAQAVHEKEFDQQFQAVEKTRQQFKDVDFDYVNPETGKSLEYEVLEFMQKSGIQDFNAAFKAYHHDSLVKMQVEQARAAQEKAEVERKKNGILDIKSTPKTRTPNLQGKNLDQLMDIALKDQDIFGAS